MLVADGEDHKRLRGLVQKAFTPGALKKLEGRIARLTEELLDRVDGRESFDLIEHYALPIPVTVIRTLLGVEADDMPRFTKGLRALTRGFSFWSIPAWIPALHQPSATGSSANASPESRKALRGNWSITIIAANCPSGVDSH